MRALRTVLALFRQETGWLVAGALLALLTVSVGMLLLASAGALVAVSAGLAVSVFGVRALALGRVLSRYSERVVTHEAIFRVLARLRIWFFTRMVPLAPAQLGFSRSGDLLNRVVADIDALDGLYLRVLVPLGLFPVVLIGGGILLSRLDLILAVMSVGLLVIFAVVVAWLVLQRASRAAADAVLQLADLRVQAVDGLAGLPDLLANDAAGAHQATLARTTSALVRSQLAVARATAASAAVTACVATGLFLSVLWLAPRGMVIPLVFGTVILAELLGQIPAAFINLGRLKAAAARVVELAECPPAVQDPAQPAPYPADQTLAFEGVTLRYPGRPEPALHGVTLTLTPGERVLIQGPSGAGKSSLIALLLKFRTPTTGRITLGGVDLATLRGDDVRARIGYLSQRTHLLSGTVREALHLAAPEADEPALWAALQAVELDSVVRALPQGLDTWVGEGGLLLSGGQARRLALAQVVLKNAPVWILDEPTEGLDDTTAHALMSTLACLIAGRTLLLITHDARLTEALAVSRTIRMTGGKIVTPPHACP